MKKTKLLATVMLTSVILAGCGNSSTETTVAETTATETEVTTVAETEAPTEEVIENTPMGTTASLANWDITVSSMQMMDIIPDGYGQYEAESGNKYMLVTLTAANNGKEADTFLPSFSTSDEVRVKVLYGDGYEFQQTNLLGYSKSMVDSHINPLSSKEGDIAFELPTSVTDSTEPLVLSISCGNEKVNFLLR